MLIDYTDKDMCLYLLDSLQRQLLKVRMAEKAEVAENIARLARHIEQEWPLTSQWAVRGDRR